MSSAATYPFRSEQAKAEYVALLEERAKAWPVPSETRVLDTPSAETFVRISGRPGDPPLVLLHGSKAHSLTWVPNIAALSAHHRIYALDTINDIGLSVSRERSGKLDHYLRWLDEVLAELIPEGTFSLAGLSLGGWLATQYALHRPERVRRLVLMAPAAAVLNVSPAMLLRATLTLIPFGDFRRKFYHWLLQDTVQSGEAARAYVDQAVGDWAAAERCFGPLPLTPASVLPDRVWQSFPVPTLFLIGEHEKMYPAHKAVARLNRVAPHIQTAIIPGAGHDLWVAQAELVNQHILRFLGEPDSRIS